MLKIRDNAPVTEPERQYYFMDICQEYVKKLEEDLGHKPTCCVTTFGCQMNSRDSEKLVGILEKVGGISQLISLWIRLKIPRAEYINVYNKNIRTPISMKTEQLSSFEVDV